VNLRAKASGPIPHLALPFVIKKDINFGQQDKGAAEKQCRCQFHQRFLLAFFVQIFGAKLHFSLAPKIRTKNAREKC